MRLIFSLSSDVNRLCNLQLSDAQSTRDNTDTSFCLSSHSMQISWQFHQLKLDNCFVVMAVESFSRYTIFLSFLQAPTWKQIQSSFLDSYSTEVFQCFERGSFMGWHQREIVDRNFQNMQDPVLVESTSFDMLQLSLKAQQSLQELHERQISQLELAEILRDLSVQMNQMPHRQCDNQHGDVFFPLERFLSDSLYRFARGLCDLEIPGCKAGEFPNPYRADTELCAVRG